MNHDELQHRRDALSRDYSIWMEGWIAKGAHSLHPRRRSPLHLLQRTIERQFLPHYFGAPPRWRLLLRRVSGKRTLPDFIVVGPIKGGTSDLAIQLILHPNVIAPLAKEFTTPNPEEWRIFYPTERRRQALERKGTPTLSPYLAPSLHSMEIAYNLSKACPDSKVVITLREPAHRMYSHWKWEVLATGRERANRLPFLSTFSAYVNTSLAVYSVAPMFTACSSNGLESSIYWKSVQYWIECFGEQNVFVLDVADYFMDRDSVMHSLQDFVGLPRATLPSFPRIVNENPLQLPPPDSASMSRLMTFFKPHNEKLWGIIGKRFPWNS